MSVTLWEKDSKIVEVDGKFSECETCPCAAPCVTSDTPCVACTDGKTPLQRKIRIAGGSPTGCNGDYTLTQSVLDPCYWTLASPSIIMILVPGSAGSPPSPAIVVVQVGSDGYWYKSFDGISIACCDAMGLLDNTTGSPGLSCDYTAATFTDLGAA